MFVHVSFLLFLYLITHICSWIFMQLGMCCLLQKKILLIPVFYGGWDPLVNTPAGENLQVWKVNRGKNMQEKCKSDASENASAGLYSGLHACWEMLKWNARNWANSVFQLLLDTWRSCTREAPTSFSLPRHRLPTACDILLSRICPRRATTPTNQEMKRSLVCIYMENRQIAGISNRGVYFPVLAWGLHWCLMMDDYCWLGGTWHLSNAATSHVLHLMHIFICVVTVRIECVIVTDYMQKWAEMWT